MLNCNRDHIRRLLNRLLLTIQLLLKNSIHIDSFLRTSACNKPKQLKELVIKTALPMRDDASGPSIK